LSPVTTLTAVIEVDEFASTLMTASIEVTCKFSAMGLAEK
jgi:hypothetical protein